MTGRDLRAGRLQKGWTQEEAASRLRVSQPYLSLLEKGMRRVPEKLARKAATVNGLSAATLPVERNWNSAQTKNEKTLAADLAALEYPVETLGEGDKAEALRNQELLLERSRLLLEDTLCHDSLTSAEARAGLKPVDLKRRNIGGS